MSVLPAAALLSLGVMQTTSAVAAVKVKNLPAPIIAAVMQQQFKGIKIRLNNYGKKRRYTWYRGGDSWIRMPRRLGGQSQRFSFPAMNAIPWRYYVNDINSSRISVRSMRNHYFVLTVGLEERGTEVKGHCSTKSILKRAACIAGNDRSAPDVHIYGMNFTVAMTVKPSSNRRSITFNRIRVKFSTKRIRVGKRCTLGRGICKPLGGLKKRLEREVSKRLTRLLNNNRIRNAIAKGLEPTLRRQGIRKVHRVSLRNHKLRIVYE